MKNIYGIAYTLAHRENKIWTIHWFRHSPHRECHFKRSKISTREYRVGFWSCSFFSIFLNNQVVLKTKFFAAALFKTKHMCQSHHIMSNELIILKLMLNARDELANQNKMLFYQKWQDSIAIHLKWETKSKSLKLDTQFSWGWMLMTLNRLQ